MIGNGSIHYHILSSNVYLSQFLVSVLFRYCHVPKPHFSKRLKIKIRSHLNGYNKTRNYGLALI